MSLKSIHAKNARRKQQEESEDSASEKSEDLSSENKEEEMSVVPYIGNLTSKKDFQKIERLGDGAFGTIYSVHPIIDKKEREDITLAMKVISKKRLATKLCKVLMKREMEIHSNLLSPYVSQCLNCFEDRENHYVILEHAKHGDLFSVLEKRLQKTPKSGIFFTEKEINIIAYQVCRALQYIHSQGFLHRDLKLENILVFDMPVTKRGKTTGEWKVKISDFGHAHEIGKHRHTFGPTLDYLAPEEVDEDEFGFATEKTDLWKVGVLMYELLFGILPFACDSDNDEDSTRDNIANGKYSIPKGVPISKALQKTIKNCLERYQDDRPTIDELLDYFDERQE